jgi:ribonuclease HI
VPLAAERIIHDNSELKELEKLTEELAHEPDDITVYFDGGFDKTSGRAGLGIVVYYLLS